MALTKVLKNLGHGFHKEIKEFKSIVGRIRLTSDTSAIGANYRKFGPSFGTYDFDAFVQKARDEIVVGKVGVEVVPGGKDSLPEKQRGECGYGDGLHPCERAVGIAFGAAHLA